MSWFNTRGACAERILFSKARFTRNVSKVPFGSAADTTKLSGIYSKIEKALTSGGFRSEKLPMGMTYSVCSLAEKQLIDADLVLADGLRTVYFNEPCSLTVAIGGSDLISIQSIMSGRSIIEAKNSAALAEEMLDSEISFAYSESIGYLSEHPERCGSGLELCAGLFLPSLRLLGSFEHLADRLAARGAILSPMLDCGQFAGDLYVLKYTVPHLANEDSATLCFDTLLGELDCLEQKNQKMIFPDSASRLEDSAYRALGSLSHARKMNEYEMLCQLSNIRLALSAGVDISDGLPHIEDINFMTIEGLNCSLISSKEQKCASEDELDTIRAEFLRKYICAKVSHTTV